MGSQVPDPVMNQLVDSFGRSHSNLRVSVTDRCNLRCFYCMPEHDPEFMPKAELLTFEEITRTVRVGTGLGIDRVRLTGGEPLVRRELHKLITSIVRLPGIRDVGPDDQRNLSRRAGSDVARCGIDETEYQFGCS